MSGVPDELKCMNTAGVGSSILTLVSEDASMLEGLRL
jgi:hypothetical protein